MKIFFSRTKDIALIIIICLISFIIAKVLYNSAEYLFLCVGATNKIKLADPSLNLLEEIIIWAAMKVGFSGK